MQGFYTAAVETGDWIRAGAFVLVAFVLAGAIYAVLAPLTARRSARAAS